MMDRHAAKREPPDRVRRWGLVSSAFLERLLLILRTEIDLRFIRNHAGSNLPVSSSALNLRRQIFDRLSTRKE
jgi:hypothetical protein